MNATVDSDVDPADQAAMERLAEKLGENAMSIYELAAVCSGMPPGIQAVITPEHYRQALDAGEISESLHDQALLKLEEYCGPQNSPLALRGDFLLTSKPQTDTPDIGLAALFKPTLE